MVHCNEAANTEVRQDTEWKKAWSGKVVRFHRSFLDKRLDSFDFELEGRTFVTTHPRDARKLAAYENQELTLVNVAEGHSEDNRIWDLRKVAPAVYVMELDPELPFPDPDLPIKN